MDVKGQLKQIVESKRAYEDAVKLARRIGPKLVKDARAELGLSQRDLAEKLGFSHTYISKVENRRTDASISLLYWLYGLM